ncbi:ATP-dependent DNA helicase RecG [Segnochrobactraceae bacterium EtOH-i3]
MRPEILNPLFKPATRIKGVGPKLAAAFDRLLPHPDTTPARVIDILLHLPTGAIDRRARPGIARAPHGGVVTLEVTIDRHEIPERGSRSPYRVLAFDDSGEIALIYFHGRADALTTLMPPGSRRILSGTVEWYNGRPQMAHPDYVLAPEDADRLPPLDPVYGLTEGLSGKVMGRIAREALKEVPTLPEWQDAAWLARAGWPDFATCLARLHAPEDPADLLPDAPARRRLAFDEMLANQLTLALVRASERRQRGLARPGTGAITTRLQAALPFALTGAQTRAIGEIVADLEKPERMLRLLQGDVGSGKTVVALSAMAHVAESGGQSALMAPTELLARQHFATLQPLAEAAGLKTALLTGRDRAKARAETLAGLASGDIAIVVGTHALIQDDVVFHDLALVCIDEQHRFGVEQRLALSAKGRGVDTLVMTATPIPRSLVLSYFGDMDASRLDEKPPGRTPVDTRTIPLDRLDEVVGRLESAVAKGAKAYWVCPLVSENEMLDLAAAEERFAALQTRFGDRVGLVHGQMKAAERDRAMAAFREGEIRILVATTVIEVGVDVPDATIMVIEHAERFGLAQLHQLRGRVGRGRAASTCLLLYKAPLGETARARLAILRESEDGFRIAEEDLKLRGEGDLLGTRQSGLVAFRIADPAVHGDLVDAARDDARLIVTTDPELAGPRSEALRTLLYLFDRDQSVRLLNAG